MMFNVNLGVSGQYKLMARNQYGEERVVRDWFDNLITDNGLNILATSSNSWVASGGILDSIFVNGVQKTAKIRDTSGHEDVVDQYFFHRVEWEYAAGEISATEVDISDLAVGIASDNLFSQTSVKDMNGDPTSIKLFENESLIVFYELRIYQETVDRIKNIDEYTLTIRSSKISQIGVQGENVASWAATRMAAITPGGDRGSFKAFKGELGTIYSSPTDSNSLADTVSNHTYVSGSYKRVITIKWGIAVANFAEGISAFTFQIGPAFYQVGVSPSIQKTSDLILSIDVSLSWSRK